MTTGLLALLLLAQPGVPTEPARGKHVGRAMSERSRDAVNMAAPAPPGLDAMRRIELLPLLPASGAQVRQFISYDPSGDNGDGQIPATWARYKDERGDYVFFDEFGPGCLYRQQMNVWHSPVDPQKTFIRYYFDDEREPRISMTLDAYWGRKGFTPPFVPPLCYFDDLPKNPHNGNFDRMGVSYLPMPFAKRLRIALSPPVSRDGRKDKPAFDAAWFQYTYTLLPAGEKATTWTGREDTGAVSRQWDTAGTQPAPIAAATTVSKTADIARGQWAEMLALEGRGSIASLRLTVEPCDADTFYNTRVRISWDGHQRPAVDLPLGCLFGGGGGAMKIPPAAQRQVRDIDLKTLMYGYSKGRFYCYWPMPYWKSARIVVENRRKAETPLSVTLEAAVRPAAELDYPRDRTGHFHARRTVDSQAANRGVFVRSFREEGYGKVVGLTFFTEGWSCDGDEFTFIDGSRTPQIHGDGSEDDHNAAWGGDRYFKPLWGSFTRYGDFPGVQQDYRLYLNDSYVFHRDIDITYECSALGDRRNASTESVVFYYKLDDRRCNLHATDELDVGNPESEKAHGYQITGQTWQGTVESAYDGYEQDKTVHRATDDGRAFTGSSSFTVRIDPDNDGVRLRRRVDRQHNGVQRAKVFVDGQEVVERPWYLCDLGGVPDNQRWRDTDFDIPARYTRGKERIRVTVQSVSSARPEHGINEFRYWIECFGLTPLHVTNAASAAADRNGSWKIGAPTMTDQAGPNSFWRLLTAPLFDGEGKRNTYPVGHRPSRPSAPSAARRSSSRPCDWKITGTVPLAWIASISRR